MCRSWRSFTVEMAMCASSVAVFEFLLLPCLLDMVIGFVSVPCSVPSAISVHDRLLGYLLLCWCHGPVCRPHISTLVLMQCFKDIK